MGLYEAMLIIRPDLEAEDHEELLNDFEKTISTQEGKVIKIVDWRKRRLAYEIDKHMEGHYYLAYFSGRGNIIPEIEHFFRVNDAVIRFMIVRAEEKDLAAVETEEPVEAAEAQAGVEEAADQPAPVEAVETAQTVAADVQDQAEKEPEEPGSQEPDNSEASELS